MSEQSLEDLRRELRSLGYLSHGIERWFARDPWRSGTFWRELMLVGAKAAALVSIFGAVTLTVTLTIRNPVLHIEGALLLWGIYFVSFFAPVFLLVVLTALVLRLRPGLAVDSPVGLMIVSMIAAALICLLPAVWWMGFLSPPGTVELIAFPALVLITFVVATIVLSAALLSFSIHETHRIPRIHRRSRTVPIGVAGATLLALLVVLPGLGRDVAPVETRPAQVTVRPSAIRLALIAVEGITAELVEARPAMRETLHHRARIESLESSSPAAMWATLGTGTPEAIHRVRSIEGLRVPGDLLLQSVSRFDPALRTIAPALSFVERQALPPSERVRHYVWEILAERGIPSVAVNWWVTASESSQNLTSVSAEQVFGIATSHGGHSTIDAALAVDEVAAQKLIEVTEGRPVRFATVYLPSLDILLNRLEADETTRLAASVTSLDRIESLLIELAGSGFEILFVGLPGEGQRGPGVVASTLDLDFEGMSAEDVAPTLLDLHGFPSSKEMRGESILAGSSQIRIPGFGERSQTAGAIVHDDDYYESLRALGYIQ